MTIPPYSESWQDKAVWAQAKCVASLAKVKPKLVGVPDANNMPQYSRNLPGNILTSQELKITEDYGIMELLDLLRSIQLSVEGVTKAFLRRAALAHAAVRTGFKLSWLTEVANISRRIVLSNSCGTRQSSELSV